MALGDDWILVHLYLLNSAFLRECGFALLFKCSFGPRTSLGKEPPFQFSSVTQSCPTLCDPMDCSTPGFPVYHQLLEPTQTHVQQVGDAIQPSHPLSSPSLPASNASQHQSLFQWVSSSHEVAKVLEFQLLASFLPKNTQDWSPLGWTGWISLQSKGLSRVSSNSTIQKHQFFGARLSL